MEHLNLIDTFSEFKEIKNINRSTMMNVLEDVFRNLLIKLFGTDENFDLIINPDKGDFEIWRNRKIVEDDLIQEPYIEIGLTKAKKINKTYKVGDEVTDAVKLSDFGRRSILTLRQSLTNRILELEKEHIFNSYKDRVGEIVIGEVYQVWKKEILVLDDNRNELILPRTEQIKSDFFITIKKVVREPGERAKIAVESYDERIDPVGACVGVKGSRIKSIVKELNDENIDVINFTTNEQLFITRALSPAKIVNIYLDDEKNAEVYLNPEEVSLAIGKGGLNIKLASLLTDYKIEVYRNIEEEEEDGTYDVAIEEFSDEIDEWVLNELKSIGCDTARSVLELTAEELEKRTDLEEETITEIIEVFSAEFE
ncbi:MAG: transcription termination/antitermination protein NusA [Bacteroidetes bacterium 4572_128]|nr:MAG: transcription termination/antitermination protein NusA [Bacteroidetes bacterium 4572_128]